MWARKSGGPRSQADQEAKRARKPGRPVVGSATDKRSEKRKIEAVSFVVQIGKQTMFSKNGVYILINGMISKNLFCNIFG